VCRHLWCVARQVSRCRAAESADARGFGCVMEVMQEFVVQVLKQVVSCDDTTEGGRMGYECFSKTQ
jgi:hypothetical protein